MKKKLKHNVLMYLMIAIVVLAMLIMMLVTVVLIRRQHIAEESPLESPLVAHDYDWEYLKLEDTFAYYEDDTYTSMQGIDVSSLQGEIDWKKVKQAGIEFAMIRVGYRGYSAGVMHEDTYFKRNIEQAIANDIPVGVYFFSQAVTVEEAREEAEFVLKKIKNYKIDLPVVFDMEKAGEGNGRVDNLPKDVWTENAVEFLKVIQEEGYQPMVYNSTNLFERYFNMEYLQEFDTWTAQYNAPYPTYPYTFSIWQYSCTGTVEGVNTAVDMDLMFVKKESDS